MARLMRDTRTNLMTKVGWVEDGYEGRSSRTKQLDTEEQALLFKRLVEENDESMPAYTTLERHGLVEFGFTINPTFVLGLHKIVTHDEWSAEEKLKLLRRVLDEF